MDCVSVENANRPAAMAAIYHEEHTAFQVKRADFHHCESHMREHPPTHLLVTVPPSDCVRISYVERTGCLCCAVFSICVGRTEMFLAWLIYSNPQALYRLLHACCFDLHLEVNLILNLSQFRLCSMSAFGGEHLGWNVVKKTARGSMFVQNASRKFCTAAACELEKPARLVPFPGHAVSESCTWV